LFYEEKKNPRYDVTTYVPLDNGKKRENLAKYLTVRLSRKVEKG